MKVRNKKKGSALVTVIVVMSILMITGTTILTVTTADYNMRKVESERIKNLYEADSGLNIVENIIKGAGQNAIRYADFKIREEVLPKEENITSEKLKEEFNGYFYEYLNQSVTAENLPLLKYLILNKKYIDTSNISRLKYEDADIGNEIEIVIEEGKYNFSNNLITIEVKSNFESKEGDLKNKRTVQANYEISSPLYNAEVEKFYIYPVFDNKAIAIDGNLNIDLSKNALELRETNIKGDIWVKGKKDSKDYGIVFDKYDSGIALENTIFNLNGNIYTSETFRLSSNVDASIVNGSIYANNFYVGNLSNEFTSKGNKITVEGEVILNNDLALNSENSEVILEKNFYGINDKNSLSGKLENQSSSIIVNNSKNSSLNIWGESYISGVAYLDATAINGDKYQTGESVSVKGNYLAYTDVKVDETTVLRYYSPLQLLEKENNDSSLEMKSKYFKYYYDKSPRYQLNDGGITFGNEVYSTGTYIKDGKVEYDNSINLKENKKILEKKNEFAKNVFSMGYTSGLVDLSTVYSNGIVEKTVANQINFSKMAGEDHATKGGKSLILIGNSKDIIIENNEVTIDGDKKEIKEGIIISNGNIEIRNSFDFKGTIITSGSLAITGMSNVEIAYDEKVVKEVVLDNKEKLEEVFKTDLSSVKGEEINLITDSKIYENSDILKVSKWQIIK